MVPLVCIFSNHDHRLAMGLIRFRVRGSSPEFHNSVLLETVLVNPVILITLKGLLCVKVFGRVWTLFTEVFYLWFHARLTSCGTLPSCFTHILFIALEVVCMSIDHSFCFVFSFPLGFTLGHLSAKPCITRECCNGNNAGLGARRLGFQQVGKGGLKVEYCNIPSSASKGYWVPSLGHPAP